MNINLTLSIAVFGIPLRSEEASDAPWMPVVVPETGTDQDRSWVSSFPAVGDNGLAIRFCLMAFAILILGMLLVESGERIELETGLGSSFIGATLLAGSTSLPEPSTAIAAVRLRSYAMAISNMFGSNLIMLALILPADIAYQPGLISRNRRQVWGMGVDSLAVVIVYVATLAVVAMLVP